MEIFPSDQISRLWRRGAKAFQRFCPSLCDLCRQPSHHLPLLCKCCHQDLAGFDYQQLAGNLLNHPAIVGHLPKMAFQQLVCACPYVWPLDIWLMQLKYQRRVELVPVLAHLLVATLKLIRESNQHQQQNPYHVADLLVPVPLSPLRLRQRQFNQALLLADIISREIGGFVDTSLIGRRQSLQRQVGKSGVQRRMALKNSFYITPSAADTIKGKHVAIVDDVLTTGTTANMIAKLLLKHGVATVSVYTVALSLPVMRRD
ncbi:ComF family protein [Thalassotalea maritima]|uniref:ComF family protein n=1 Tax=Thalassotalea maritima TaxID=3242416 RepID=UPI0035293508